MLAGYDLEHESLESDGWTAAEWYRSGFLKGGMGNQQHRERLWLSPHCIAPGSTPQLGLFGEKTP